MPFVQLQERNKETGHRMRSFRVNGVEYRASQYVEVPESDLPDFRKVAARVMLPPPDPELIRRLRLAGHKPRAYRPAPPAFLIFMTEEEKEAHRLQAIVDSGREPMLDQSQIRQELADTKAIVASQAATVERLTGLVERLLARETGTAIPASAETTSEAPPPVPVFLEDDEDPDTDPPHVITTAKIQGKKGRRR